MKKHSLPAFIVLFLLSCGGNGGAPGGDSAPPLEDVLTLELSFGDTDLPEEYLLAQPRGYAVGDNGDIIIADEQKLKIYDSAGEPKRIVSGPGEGPGEFANSYLSVFKMQNGALAVMESGSGKRISFFSREYEHESTLNLQARRLYRDYADRQGWPGIHIGTVFPVTQDHWLVQAYYSNPDNSDIHYLLIDQKNDDLSLIMKSKGVAGFDVGPLTIYIPERGGLTFCPLPGGRVAYSETNIDRIEKNGESSYLVHLYDMQTGKAREILRRYEPVAIPDSVKAASGYGEYDDDHVISRDASGAVTTVGDLRRIRWAELDKLKYYPGIRRLQAAGDILMVITHKVIPGKGDVADLFDINTGEYHGSAVVPFSAVYEGERAYRIDSGSGDTFPKMCVYRVDPALYGK